jgi:valyl-tRNA synthetase
VLETALRLLHPLMPFITEEIWQKLPEATRGKAKGERAESIMIAAFPTADSKLINPEAEQDMQMVMDLILAIRNIRGVMNIPPSTQLTVIVKPASGELGSHLEKNGEYVRTLARVKELRIGVKETKPKTAATGVIKSAEVYVPLEGVLDLGEERMRLQKEIAKVSQDVEMFSKKLSNKNFVDKAPKAVVEKDTARLEELKGMREKLEQSMKMLG